MNTIKIDGEVAKVVIYGTKSAITLKDGTKIEIKTNELATIARLYKWAEEGDLVATA